MSYNLGKRYARPPDYIRGAKAAYGAARSLAGMATRAYKRYRGPTPAELEMKYADGPVKKVWSGDKYGANKYGRSYSTKSYARRNPKMYAYMGALKHVLSEPRTDMYNNSVSINNEVSMQQNQCGWYSWAALTPQLQDNMLSSGYNGGQVTGTAVSGAVSGVEIDGGIPIAQVPSDYEVFFERSARETIMKNSSSQQVRLTLWECYPRRDLPSTVSAPRGADPQLLLDGFADTVPDNLPGGSGAADPPILFNTYGATPFQSAEWVGSFKMKQLHNCVIQPGEQLIHTLKNDRSFLLSKRTYGVKTSSSIQGNYVHTRHDGMIILMRVEGMPVHSEPAVVHTARNENTLVATGTYALDIVQTNRVVYRVPFRVAQRRTALSNAVTNSYILSSEFAFQQYAPEIQKTG